MLELVAREAAVTVAVIPWGVGGVWAEWGQDRCHDEVEDALPTFQTAGQPRKRRVPQTEAGMKGVLQSRKLGLREGQRLGEREGSEDVRVRGIGCQKRGGRWALRVTPLGRPGGAMALRSCWSLSLSRHMRWKAVASKRPPPPPAPPAPNRSKRRPASKSALGVGSVREGLRGAGAAVKGVHHGDSRSAKCQIEGRRAD